MLCEQMAPSLEILHTPCYIKPWLTQSNSLSDVIDFLRVSGKPILGVLQAVVLARASKHISQAPVDAGLLTRSVSQHFCFSRCGSERNQFIIPSLLFHSVLSPKHTVGFSLLLFSEGLFLPCPPPPSSTKFSLVSLFTPTDTHHCEPAYSSGPSPAFG